MHFLNSVYRGVYKVLCLEADIYAQKHKCKSRHIPKHVKAHFCSFSSFHALVCPFQHISGFFLFSAHFRHLFALLSTFQIFFFLFLITFACCFLQTFVKLKIFSWKGVPSCLLVPQTGSWWGGRLGSWASLPTLSGARQGA